MKITAKDIASTTIRLMASDLEALALRQRILREALEKDRSDHPECLPPVVGEDGSLTFYTIDEVKNGMTITRRRRFTD